MRVVPISPPLGLFASPAFPADGLPGFEAVVYNSLVVGSVPDELEVTAWSDPAYGTPTIQGLKHREYLIWGVQYHPEVGAGYA